MGCIMSHVQRATTGSRSKNLNDLLRTKVGTADMEVFFVNLEKADTTGSVCMTNSTSNLTYQYVVIGAGNSI